MKPKENKVNKNSLHRSTTNLSNVFSPKSMFSENLLDSNPDLNPKKQKIKRMNTDNKSIRSHDSLDKFLSHQTTPSPSTLSKPPSAPPIKTNYLESYVSHAINKLRIHYFFTD